MPTNSSLGPRPRHWLTGALLAAALLAACAQNPDTVAPFTVSGAQYQSLQCPQLGRELAGLNEKIAVMSTQQRTKRVRDTVGWIFLLMPTASMNTADTRSKLAILMGEREAIEQTMASRCVSYRS